VSGGDYMGMIVIWLCAFFSLLSILFGGIYLSTDNIIFKYIGLLFLLSSLACVPYAFQKKKNEPTQNNNKPDIQKGEYLCDKSNKRKNKPNDNDGTTEIYISSLFPHFGLVTFNYVLGIIRRLATKCKQNRFLTFLVVFKSWLFFGRPKKFYAKFWFAHAAAPR
jgi:hypothetical protein